MLSQLERLVFNKNAFQVTDETQRGLQEVGLQANVISSVDLPILPGPSLKRKREEIADSESEEEEIGSDEEFGWIGDDPLAVEVLDNDATILNRIRTVQSEDE